MLAMPIWVQVLACRMSLTLLLGLAMIERMGDSGPASMQVDETNFKAALGQNALDAMEVIINRSKHMAASVAEYRQAQGGRAALKEQVLQTSNAERGGCLPNEAEAPLVGLSFPTAL